MISVAVVDDEQKARETIINILRMGSPDIEVAGEAESVSSGYELISSRQPDVVLLDINLSDGTGFDLVRRFDPENFKVIFITAHEEYAIKAFKFSAIDYILKPVVAGDLLQALEKARKSINREETGVKLATLLSNLEKIRKIVLKTAESIHIVHIRNIIRCEADVNYTRFFLDSGERLLVSRTLKEFEEMLETAGFFRIHQSHLVNLEHVRRYDKADGGFLIMDDGSEVPVASRKKDDLFRIFENL
ncbi:MAG: response regulator transcription factor [Bacteroidales bacterium]|nr:response regulator transcription factor [Bacteroidales bacterium]